MAAAALTETNTRESILGWQSAKVGDFTDLIFCTSEEGVQPHGQYRKDILDALEALRTIPVPLCKVNFEKRGTARNPRYDKQFTFVIASIFQSYGVTVRDRETGEEVLLTGPAPRKGRVAVKKRPNRRKSISKQIATTSPLAGILEAYPPNRYPRTHVHWRWNTDIAEDFICPGVALDERGRPRRKLKGGVHHEGKRFVNVHSDYFAVQSALRKRGTRYAQRLFDLIISEKTHITDRARGAVWIEIQAEKIIKWLGLWPDYEVRPKRVLEERIAPAIIALLSEKVLLPPSDQVPRQPGNLERRTSPYYRWKVAEKWTTVALVTAKEGKAIEEELAEKTKVPKAAPSETEQAILPGLDTPPGDLIPSGSDIRAAREAAGITLRDFARLIDGPDHSTWARYEKGKTRSVRTTPEVWQRIRDFIRQQGEKASS